MQKAEARSHFIFNSYWISSDFTQCLRVCPVRTRFPDLHDYWVRKDLFWNCSSFCCLYVSQQLICNPHLCIWTLCCMNSDLTCVSFPSKNKRFCCTTVLILQHFFSEEMKEEENNSDQKRKMESIVANNRKTTSPLHPGLSARSCAPYPSRTREWFPPHTHFIFSLLFYFFPRRAIEINPSEKRKRANKMMKRHWQ